MSLKYYNINHQFLVTTGNITSFFGRIHMVQYLQQFNYQTLQYQVIIVYMNSNYICVNCQTHFTEEDMYKAHYKSEHHRYNVKRKLIAMPPLSLHQYTLQLQAQMSSKSQSNAQIYCQVCSKKFMSSQTYKQHINSSRHKTNRKALLKNKSESSSLSEFELIDQKGAEQDICPFCIDKTTDDHLHKQHCFPPFRNQCIDIQGLLQKIRDDVKAGKCVYCGCHFACEQSAKQHMNDVGHAKLDIDNFGPYEPFYLWKINQSVEEEDQETAQVVDMQKKQSQSSLLHHDTLESLEAKRQARIKYGLTGVIINGKQVGYRAYRQYYKQHLQREIQPAPRQHLKSIINQNWNLPRSITYITQKPQFQQVQSHNNPR